MDNKEIDSLRQFIGTLPARTREEDWLDPEYVRGISNLKVRVISPVPRASILRDWYKGMVEGAASTWGDGNVEGNWACKWDKMEPAARYRVMYHICRRETLPMIWEDPKIQIQVEGGPRHFFDQAARTRLGANFKSIGCRDNSKLSSEFVLYSNLYDMLHAPQTEKERIAAEAMHEAFVCIKKAYKAILDTGQGSYQIGRSVLPMSYHHQYSASYNLMALLGVFFRRSCLQEEEHIVAFAWLLRKMMVEEFKSNMFGNIMRPPCYRSKKCHYTGTMHGTGGLLFSNLFAATDPVCKSIHGEDVEYAEFNQSCTSSEELIKYDVGFRRPEDYVFEFPESYEEAKPYLSSWEIEAFESR
jgi:hypothetical protein